MKKDEKWKQSVFVLQWTGAEAVHTPSSKRDTAKLLPWEQPAAVALNYVSIYALSGFIL